MMHFSHDASAGTSVAYLLCGVKFAGSHLCTNNCTYFIFHLLDVFPANQRAAASQRLSVSLLPTGPGPTCDLEKGGDAEPAELDCKVHTGNLDTT